MHQQRGKRILIYFILLILVGSINNINLTKIKLINIKNINVSGLDDCNGEYGPTPDFPDSIYHYHTISVAPYIIGAYCGDLARARSCHRQAKSQWSHWYVMPPIFRRKHHHACAAACSRALRPERRARQ